MGDEATTAVGQEEQSPNIDDPFRGGRPIAEALEKLRLRLLDLTGRNRLLNFRHTAAKTLQFVEGDIGVIYDKLIETQDRRISLIPVPEPKRADWVQRQGRLCRPDIRDHAKALGISTSYELPCFEENERPKVNLQSLHYPDDLERHCRKLARDAKTAIEETGANMLFLVLGFLEFPESPNAEKLMLAPLVPVPVKLEKGDLERASGAYRYHLMYTGEELAENLSLREKLKTDFNLELPVFVEEASLDTYYREVERAIEGKPGFRLHRQATVALVSMTKMLLVRDLDPKNWPLIENRSALIDHEIVRMVFEGRKHEGEAASGEEYEVDKHKHANLPLIFDADSTQHSALIDVLDGKNLVVEGPPGTGKSQTITNLIAGSIARGKKVLFVAEKLAALQVVKKRLTQAGLADFCLELHSNKTSKKDVLEAIGTRSNRHYRAPSGLGEQLEALQEKRKTLSAYVELINSRAGNAQGLTVHEVLWKAERFRQGAGDGWREAQRIKFIRAPELTRSEFESLHGELARLVDQHRRIERYGPSAAFWGFFPDGLEPAGELEIERAIETAFPAVEHLRKSYLAAAQVLGESELGLSHQEAQALAGSLSRLAAYAPDSMAEEALPNLFCDRDPRGLISIGALRRLRDQQDKSKALRDIFAGKLRNELRVSTEIRQEAESLISNFTNLGLQAYSPEKIEELARANLEAVSEVKGALDECRTLAKMSGLEFFGTDHCVARVAVPIELAIACPRENLHRRAPELSAPGVANVIRGARQRFQLIAKERLRLSELFYLDMPISEEEVEQSVLVLREGEEWWRIFQIRHRQALGLHKRYAKSKKIPKAQRRKELESLLAHVKEARAARDDVRYRRAMGPQFNADATEFDALHAIASWIEVVNARLLEAELDGGAFSAMTATSSLIVSLSRSGERLSRAKKSLDSCARLLVEGPLSQAAATRKAFVSAKGWPDRIALLTNLAQRLSQHAATLRAWGATSQGAADTVAAIRGADEYRQIVEAVDKDSEAKKLIGDRHRGLETNLEPVLQAHAYGTAVHEMELSDFIERMLLGESGNATRKAYLASLLDIDRAWLPVEQFCDFLGARGQLELVAWAGADPSNKNFIDGFLKRMERARGAIGTLLHWVQYVQAARFVRERGLGEFVDLLETDSVAREQIPYCFGYRFYGSIAENIFADNRALGRFSGLGHEAIRKEFARLDREIIKIRGKELAAESASRARPPAGTSGSRVSEKTEQALLDYLLPQNRPRMPIRQMMKAGGRAIQEYMPCFMMGPQAVAQYLAPGALNFDVVVMDEASQLKPEEALGAIARGRQLVVVGDPKQLPPTSFFDKLGETQQDDDGGAQAALTLESILDVCMGHFRPVRTLKWHYRSRHESLIAFSNRRFYRDQLIVFPSPYERSRNLGVKLRYIEGATYQNSMNLAEANVVVDAVLHHMRERPNDSLGVVTLNLKQRELIEELLDKKMRSLDYAERFVERWDKEGYDFFVKNLENVQGDERDVIFISTTFGPAPDTKVVYQRFGPISRDDGWRRLNVLFTRSRKALMLFTSMRSTDIVDGDGVPRGTRELRRYLEYASTGTLPQRDEASGGGEPESDFEIAVMEELGRHGYECTPQLGVAGFRIDLAVRHPNYPNTHMAAIECDGAAYHSGRSARDRDRIRQEILESIGWRDRIWRIWSTDWYRAPGKELARLVNWLDQLKSKPMDQAYLVTAESELVPATPVQAADAAMRIPTQLEIEALGVIIDREDDLLEVQVGDRVTYALLADNKEAIVTIGVRTDPARGIVAYTTPIADALLGLQQGEIGALRLPDRPAARFKVARIERLKESAQSSSK